jgi:hypothetical protein
MSSVFVELNSEEEIWWAETIKKFRTKYIKEPKYYASDILRQKKITEKELFSNVDSLLSETREQVWQMYLQDEVIFHAEVLAFLFQNRELPKTVLNTLLNS